MSIVLGTFNPKQIVLSYASIILSGFVDFVYTPDGEDWEFNTSADGHYERFLNAGNGGASCKIQLIQTNLVNDLMSIQRIKELNGAPGAVFMAKDLTGAGKYTGIGTIKGRPPQTWAGSANNVTWDIQMGPKHISFAGGNLF